VKPRCLKKLEAEVLKKLSQTSVESTDALQGANRSTGKDSNTEQFLARMSSEFSFFSDVNIFLELEKHFFELEISGT